MGEFRVRFLNRQAETTMWLAEASVPDEQVVVPKAGTYNH